VIEGRSVLSLNLFASHASVFLTRAGAAWCMLAGLALAIGSARSPGWLKAVSSRAFSIYVLHLVILYGLPTIDGLEQRMGPSLDLVETFTLGPILLLTCAVLLGALSSTWQQAVLFARKVFKRWLAVRRSPADLDT
jgi:surface polysaccharide O-acyltransferase-like enzyme